MTHKSYYIDSCIWLNLFKKEGNPSKGVPSWKIADKFIKSVILSSGEIAYSGIILKELRFKLTNDHVFRERELLLKKEGKFRFVEVTREDYAFARKLESDLGYELSFYDCLHLAICKRLGLTLVTRDSNLIRIGRRYISVDKPENLFFT